MKLTAVQLLDFRSYNEAVFAFNNETTLIIGPNTAGKTNLLEAIYCLSFGKSFRADRELQVIRFGQDVSRIKGTVIEDEQELVLELVFARHNDSPVAAPFKKYLVNGVPKRRTDFSTHLPSILFAPSDLEIIIGSPSSRRQFLDEVIAQTDHDYAQSLSAYTKALRQRNALLEKQQEFSGNLSKQFEYWDTILIQHGQAITQKRESFIAFINGAEKNVFVCNVTYDKSEISKERLMQYEKAEKAAGNTLVGPHRDDFSVQMFNNELQVAQDIKSYGSRGQQRLVVFQLKLLQVVFLEEALHVPPLLLLDDIFSELDEENINKVLSLIGTHQTIITTTHKEFIPAVLHNKVQLVELKKTE